MLIDGETWIGTRRPSMAVEVAHARRLFTRAEYHRMGDAGIFKPTERVELIEGEIIEMSPIGPRHVAFVNNLNQLLVTRLAGRGIASIQNPVVLSDLTEPEPDVAILRRERPVPYKEAEVVTEDVLLLIEVAETSLAYDRSTKRRLYAAAGIPEYWLVDCVAESVDVYRAPGRDGYAEVSRVSSAAATLGPQAFPGVTVTLAEVFA
jgi:hypothetical protein